MKETKRWKFIYNQLNGLNEPDVCEWVRDESTTQGELGPLIEQAYAVRDRLADRLGVDPAQDADLEELVSRFEAISQVCGKWMYHYGRLDGRE